jgi:hypothetical protein
VDCKHGQTVNSDRSGCTSPRCPEGSHTVPDATGATCRCEEGFDPDTRTNSTSTLSCHLRCGSSEASSDGATCACTGNTYDTSLHGILICSASGWEPAEIDHTYQEAQQLRSQGVKCVACPTECIRCTEQTSGIATVREGWRLNVSTTAALVAQLAQGKDGRPQQVYSCPYQDTDCPEFALSGTLDEASCRNHHTGPLCATCEQGFSRRGSSDNACEECRDISDYIATKFGLPVVWFAVIVATVVLAVCVAVCLLAEQLRWVKKEVKCNLRIVIGSAQVLSLLPSVLELVFPPHPRAALSFVGLFVADLREILRFECWGWTWYDKWLASVFGLPLLLALPIAAHWLWHYCPARHIAGEAKQATVGALFFVAMLIYPQLSASILSALRCRQLGEESSYLEADYSVDCTSQRYSDYNMLALVLVAVVPFGFPLGLLAALLHQWRHSREPLDQANGALTQSDATYDEDASAAEEAVVPLAWLRDELLSLRPRALQKRADEAGVDEGALDEAEDSDAIVELILDRLAAHGSLVESHYQRVHVTFGFCMEDYRNECYWFEPVDLLRKLALSGLLQFVHRGTAAQCFCGSAIAFVSFGVQQWLRPYREPESNVLKALVDTQLFLTFLISFILKVLPGSTAASRSALCSTGGCCCARWGCSWLRRSG